MPEIGEAVVSEVDLVERLRNSMEHEAMCDEAMCDEAADEIEDLRELNERYRNLGRKRGQLLSECAHLIPIALPLPERIRFVLEMKANLAKEVEQLQQALRMIADGHGPPFPGEFSGIAAQEIAREGLAAAGMPALAHYSTCPLFGLTPQLSEGRCTCETRVKTAPIKGGRVRLCERCEKHKPWLDYRGLCGDCAVAETQDETGGKQR